MLEPNRSRRDPYTRFRRTLLTPDEVRELSQLSPQRPIRDVAFLWLQILAAWWAISVWTQWWVVLLAIPFIGTRHYALHVIGHDGVHRRLLRSGRANDLFNDLVIYGAEGAVTRINGQNHLAHHKLLATEEDPDRHKYSSANKTTRLEFFGYLCGLRGLGPLWRNVFTKTRSSENAAKNHDGDKQSNGYSARDVLILAGWQSMIFAGLSWTIGWWAYLVVWLLPVYVFTYCADLVRFFLEHSYPEPDEVADDRRLITFSSSPLELVFFAPKNINLHAVHHLWPSIPYYNLPKADAMIRSRTASKELNWRGSYLKTLVGYFRALPIPECRNPSG